MAVGIVGVVDLIADTPQDHAWVVAVAQDHICEITLVPHGKISVISLVLRGINIVSLPPLIFGSLPLIKRLIHHEKAKDITQRVQFGHMRIVAHADRVAAHFFELYEPAAPYLVGDSGAKAAGVVMQTDALEEIGFPVEEKASVGVKAEASDADLHLMYLIRFLVGDIRFHRVQVRVFRRPEFGGLYGSAICDLFGGMCHDGCLRDGFAYKFSCIVKNDVCDTDQTVLVCRIG